MMSKSLKKWLISDELWSRIEPLLPPRKVHPLGCHRPRVDDRAAMNAIFFVLRTGCHRMPVERFERDGTLQFLFGTSSVSGMAKGGGVRAVVARGAGRIR